MRIFHTDKLVNPFVRLPQSNLEALLAGFRSGPLKYGTSLPALIASGAPAELAEKLLTFIHAGGYSGATMAAVLEAVLDARRHATDVSLTQSLVVTGPSVAQLEKLKTGARFVQVVEHAKRELMLATFALYQGYRIHQAMTRNPSLQVTLILNVPRKYGDRTQTDDLLESARQDFSKNWPWPCMPAVWYFPESVCLNAVDRASMHAKFVIADEERCFITSANFTEAAQKKNIEVGVELNHSHEPKVLSRYFKQLMTEGRLKRFI
jgi:phosphatidylserine/phosphatidylglycerophosphate/cardiolipin synthase-like enzyme